MQLDRDDAGAELDERPRERARASADVDDEIARPKPGVSDELLRPSRIELMPSPGAPWHGHGDGRPSRSSRWQPAIAARWADCDFVDVDAVAAGLGLDATYGPWLRALDATEPDASFALPCRDDAERLLLKLGVPDDDLEAVLSVWPEPDRDVELWWLLQRCHARFLGSMGNGDAFIDCPALPRELDLKGRCFWVFAYASMVEVTRAFHGERGVPDDISWATLADLGQQLVIHRKRRGTTGLDLQWWLVPHFLGALYALGRLQFHLYHLRVGIAGPAFWRDTDEPGFRKGDATLGVHIPATGPLVPSECDASFALAGSFVRGRFPEHDFRVATCTSWLLDEQLADYLPDDSNIVRFQRRFTVVDGATDDGHDTLRFVFDRVPESIDDLPQHTRLERAIVTHLRKGGRWRTRTGWLVP